MKQIALEQKYIVLIAPVRKGRNNRHFAGCDEGKAFPLLIQLIYLYLEKIVGGLATSALSYGLTGEATFNVLNISNFGAGASCGLLEVSVGNDGVKTRLGTGGTDVSVGTLLSAISGIKNLGMNEKIKKAAQENNMAQSATALRMLYGFGDDKGLELLDDVLNKKVSLAAGSGPENAQTILENGKRTVYLNGYSNDMTREEQLKLGITLGHEAYRDGVKGSIEKQMAETFSAVAGHTAMIKRVQNDSLYSSVMTGIIESDMNLKNDVTRFDYALKNNDWSSFGEYVLGNYDSSADYWKLVKNTDGQYGWQEDGKLDFYLEDGSKIDADYFDGYLNGTVSITGPENVEAKNKLIQNLKDSGYSKKEIKEFLNGTAGFADASVAARNLMSGKLSQSELDAMNKGLYAAQESGLLVKNGVLNPVARLIGSGTSDDPYFSLNSRKDGTIKISGKAGYRIVNLEMYEKVGKNGQNPTYPLYEFALVKHNGYDGVGGGAIVANENGSLSLTYDNVHGLRTDLQGAFDSYQVSHGSTDTIMNYFAQFGSSGTSMSYANGMYSLNGVTAGTQIGTMGSTGYATNVHAHMTVNGSGEQFENKFYSESYPSYELIKEYTIVDSYAKYMTGYKYNNFYSNQDLWDNLYHYSSESPYLNYQNIQSQHYLEYEYYNHLHNFSKPILRK